MEQRLEQAFIRETRAALDRVADNPHVALDSSAVRTATKAVVDNIKPVADHFSNAEAWWRSRVTIGSLTSMIGGAIAIGTGIAARSTDAELYASGLAALIGGGFALYGRWLASRPLGN